VSKFDFTVNIKDGSYLTPWDQALNAAVVERVVRAVLAEVSGLTVEAATRSQSLIEAAVQKALAGEGLASIGVAFESCSVLTIEPLDEELAETMGAKERQAMLTESDKALHDRRMEAATNERAVKTYEAETRLELEKKQSKLLDEQAKNKEKEAAADAKATTIRLAPLKNVASGKLLGAAIMDAAKSGRLGSLAITSEFLAAVNQK
jgi:hypothetical protein